MDGFLVSKTYLGGDDGDNDDVHGDGQCSRNLLPVLLYILVKQIWIWKNDYSILVGNILVTH